METQRVDVDVDDAETAAAKLEAKRAHAHAVHTVVAELGEHKRESRDAVDAIFLFAKAFGLEFIRRHAEHAKDVYEAGGMLRPDGLPRTLGGIFFQLVKAELGQEEYRRVCPSAYGLRLRRRQHKKEVEAKAAAKRAAAAAVPDEPHESAAS